MSCVEVVESHLLVVSYLTSSFGSDFYSISHGTFNLKVPTLSYWSDFRRSYYILLYNLLNKGMIFHIRGFGSIFQFFVLFTVVSNFLYFDFAFNAIPRVYFKAVKPFWRYMLCLSFFFISKLLKGSLPCSAIHECRSQWKLSVLFQYRRMSYSAMTGLRDTREKIRCSAFSLRTSTKYLNVVRGRNILSALIWALY